LSSAAESAPAFGMSRSMMYFGIDASVRSER
jgi:hypothetical protein